MAFVFLVAPPTGSLFLLASLTTLGPWLREHGLLALLIYLVLTALLIGVSLLPTYACAILAGWAFGFAVGTPLAVVAITLGALLAYAIGRRIAQKRVVDVINERPKWRAVHQALLSQRSALTRWVIFLVRIPPTSPFGFTCFLFSATHVPLREYAIGTFFGMIPRTAVTCYLAAVVQQALEFSAKPTWYVVSSSIAMIVVITIIGVMANRALRRVTASGNAAA